MCSYILWLVWTPCLKHMCVCIWRYILQNYNYKLHFQNLFIYHIPHVFIETLAVENLDVCTTCDLWDNNIQLTMVKDRRWQIYPNVVRCQSCQNITMLRDECTHTFLYVFGHCVENICWFCCWYWYQNLGGAPLGAGHAFPRQWHMCIGGGVIYFCQGFLPYMMPSMDGW